MCLEGTTSQDMYGSTPVAMYKESVLRRSAFQAHRVCFVPPDTACPVTVAALRSAFQARIAKQKLFAYFVYRNKRYRFSTLCAEHDLY